MLTLVIVAGDFREPVEINSTDVEFISPTDYQKKQTAVLDSLRSEAEKVIGGISLENDNQSSVMKVFLAYSGQLAAETMSERAQLAKEYAERYSNVVQQKWKAYRIRQEEYRISQLEKGLVEYRGEWVTLEVRKAKVEQEEKLEQQIQRQAQAQQAYESSQVELVSWSYQILYGTILHADFVIRNRTLADVKDFEIVITHKAPSGTEIDSNTRTIYQRISAGKSIRIIHCRPIGLAFLE